MGNVQVRSLESIERALQRLAVTEPGSFDFVLLVLLAFVVYLRFSEWGLSPPSEFPRRLRALHATFTLRRPLDHRQCPCHILPLIFLLQAFDGGSIFSNAEHITQQGRHVHRMNERIRDDPRVTASLLPFTGGTWIVVKK